MFNLLFVLVGELMKLRLLDRDNWFIVFWIVVFKCINWNVKVDFLLVNFDCILIFCGDFLLESWVEIDRLRGVGDDVKSKFN